jgi:membrane protease YdiL (CAAX protease family)
MGERLMKKYEVLSVILIIIAEIFLFFGYGISSVAIHSINILLIIGFTILKSDHRLIQALLLVSLLRIVNLSLPVFFSFTIYWFASLYGIMFIPIALTIREQNLRLRDLGMTFSKIYLLPFAIILGIGLGIIEFIIFSPSALIPNLTPGEIFKLSIVMFFFIGLVEEIIFRSMLQQRLEEKIGLFKGLIVASIIFGAMHSGYSNYYEFLFASFAGLMIGFGFQRTRSLPFAIIAHGVNNVILYGILPFIIFP